MWLLSTDLAELSLFSSPDEISGGYAILSHVWQPGEEQSFQDIKALQSNTPTSLDDTPRSRAHRKIRECCILAEKHGYRWVWIDTCCIDKTSSAELSEAINSMYLWYSRAAVCYAYLYDVASETLSQESQFYKSRWFTRGWTLQELIAPRSLVFVLNNWTILGSKTDLVKHVEKITKISADILVHRRPLQSISIARRMSWASRRKTTRVEDEAYSLMGMFGINMPTIYGEGRAAFYRLQEEIMKLSPDETLFVWGPQIGLVDILKWAKSTCSSRSIVSHGFSNPRDCCLLAQSPQLFDIPDECEPISVVDAVGIAEEVCINLSSLVRLESKGIALATYMDSRTMLLRRASEFIATSQGMRSRLPILDVVVPGPSGDFTFSVAVLSCRSPKTGAGMGVLLQPLPNSLDLGIGAHCDLYASGMRLGYTENSPRLVILSAVEDIARSTVERTGASLEVAQNILHRDQDQTNPFTGRLNWTNIYILHRPLPHIQLNSYLDMGNPKPMSVGFLFSRWSVVELQEWSFRPRDHLSLFSKACSATFVSNIIQEEAFTIFLAASSRAPGLPVDQKAVASASFGTTARTSYPGFDPSDAQQSQFVTIDDCEDLTATFGDNERAVKLTFHKYPSCDVPSIYGDNVQFEEPLGTCYVVDIRLSGDVYMTLRHNRTPKLQSIGSSQQEELQHIPTASYVPGDDVHTTKHNDEETLDSCVVDSSSPSYRPACGARKVANKNTRVSLPAQPLLIVARSRHPSVVNKQ